MKKILLIIILCFSVKVLICQNDSTTISKAEPDSLIVKNDRIYKLFLEENNQEIKHLFKFNIIGLSQLAPVLAYEQKIGKSFSSETSISIGSTSKLDGAIIYYDNTKRSQFDYGYYLGCFEMIKYYHNLSRRQNLGKNTNGFAGNYFAVQIGAVYINDVIYYQRYFDHEIYYEADLTYGIQRRIGNIGYIEPSVSLFLRPENGGITTVPTINLEMGFAIDSFSNLERMLKK